MTQNGIGAGGPMEGEAAEAPYITTVARTCTNYSEPSSSSCYRMINEPLAAFGISIVHRKNRIIYDPEAHPRLVPAVPVVPRSSSACNIAVNKRLLRLPARGAQSPDRRPRL